MATLITTIVWALVVKLTGVADLTKSGVILYWLSTFTFIAASRLQIQKWLYGRKDSQNMNKIIYIYGAGVAGTQLASLLDADPGYVVEGFIDDNSSLKGWNVLGFNVQSFDKTASLLIDASDNTEVIQDKVVLITGAGGSIGSELCRQVLSLKPQKLILLELSEFALYKIEQELEEIKTTLKLNIEIERVLGSSGNPKLLEKVFGRNQVQTIYHAAAYKHVPLVEENPVSGLTNNIFGTKAIAEKALAFDVETFILISTDKAVRPTNIMGCSKRIAEMVLQSLAEQSGAKTTFSMVRFGNVLI